MAEYRGWLIEVASADGERVQGRAMAPGTDEGELSFRTAGDDAETVIERLVELIDDDLGPQVN